MICLTARRGEIRVMALDQVAIWKKIGDGLIIDKYYLSTALHSLVANEILQVK